MNPGDKNSPQRSQWREAISSLRSAIHKGAPGTAGSTYGPNFMNSGRGNAEARLRGTIGIGRRLHKASGLGQFQVVNNLNDLGRLTAALNEAFSGAGRSSVSTGTGNSRKAEHAERMAALREEAEFAQAEAQAQAQLDALNAAPTGTVFADDPSFNAITPPGVFSTSAWLGKAQGGGGSGGIRGATDDGGMFGGIAKSYGMDPAAMEAAFLDLVQERAMENQADVEAIDKSGDLKRDIVTGGYAVGKYASVVHIEGAGFCVGIKVKGTKGQEFQLISSPTVDGVTDWDDTDNATSFGAWTGRAVELSLPDDGWATIIVGAFNPKLAVKLLDTGMEIRKSTYAEVQDAIDAGVTHLGLKVLPGGRVVFGANAQG